MNEQHRKLKKKENLFRKEAITYQKNNSLGNVILTTPISFSIWSYVILCIAVTLILFLCFGKYTRRQEVLGILNPDKGVISVYPQKPGIVIKKFIKHGDEVQKGQLLYIVSTEQKTQQNIGLFIQQILLIEQQIFFQEKRIKEFSISLKNYKELLENKLITKKEYQKYYDEYLNAKIELLNLKKYLKQTEAEKEYSIHAQDEGIVSALFSKIGEKVTINKIMLSIIPKNTKLQVEILIPSEAIGFVKVRQKVLLKYRAFPYQKFGLYEAEIENVDKSILSAQESNSQITLEEPFYRATANLKDQHIIAYGKNHPLTAGMLVDAVILCEERTLLQWILNPLYSIKGSLAS